ncbi:GNAT family N-acetyltransferase [[Eubacterium] hominis]|uniref:GNAT family N-acetyltransferase n=1 Tax=[Eubacterium] hominis TaxID=2764325 RepID=UPI003A4DE8B4
MKLEMPEIETKRLFLRPIEEGDACDVFAYYSDPRAMQYLTISPHQTIDQTLASIRQYFLPYLKRCVPQTWVIVWKEKEKVIGNLNIHTIEDDIGEIGYVLHPAYWNKGIMKEALPHLIDAGFERIGLRRIEACYEINNIASGKVLKTCGFQKEGIMRQYAKLSDGRYHDMILCAILKEDWMKGVKKK